MSDASETGLVVSGRLVHDDETRRPLHHMTVQLYDRDPLTPDDLLGWTRTDADGGFEIRVDASRLERWDRPDLEFRVLDYPWDWYVDDGEADLGFVLRHLAGGLFALGEQFLGAFVEVTEGTAEIAGLLAALGGLSVALGETLLHFFGALAGPLQELLTPFDGGGEVGLGLMAGRQLARVGVEGFAALGQGGLVAVEVGGEGSVLVGAFR